MHLNLLQIASVIALFQAVLMAVFFARDANRPNYGNRFLSGQLFVFAGLIACSLAMSLDSVKADPRYQKPLFFAGQIAFLVGPLLHFYIQSLLNPGFRLRPRHGVHLAPFFAGFLYALIVSFHLPSLIAWRYPGRLVISAAFLLQNGLYLLSAFRTLDAYGLSWRSFLSYIADTRLAWVRFFVGGYILLWAVQMQLFVGWDVLENPRWCPYVQSLYFLTVFFFFNGMVYLGLRRPHLLNPSRKYVDSPLRESEKTLVRERLAGLLKEKKIHLDPALSLPQLARTLDIAPCYLSQIINETYRENFRDFINRHRIEESKRMLAGVDGRRNVLEIAFETGFNSKSTFNTAFRKFTGTTPKEFQKASAASSRDSGPPPSAS